MVEEKNWPEHYYPHKCSSWISLVYRFIMLGLAGYAVYSCYEDEGTLPRFRFLTDICLYWNALTNVVGLLQYWIPNKKTSCATWVYGYCYVVSFSISFMVTVFYWTF